MAEFNSKNKQSFWHSPLVLIVLFGILVLFVYNMINLIEKERETTKKKNQILSNIETLRTREEALNKDIEKLKTEQGIEETIRDKYQVVKEGERMVVIVDEDNKSEVVSDEVKEEHGLWSWVKRVFKVN